MCSWCPVMDWEYHSMCIPDSHSLVLGYAPNQEYFFITLRTNLCENLNHGEVCEKKELKLSQPKSMQSFQLIAL